MDEIGFQPLQAWDSLLLASGKRSRSLVMALGTPGLDRDNALWHLRELVQGGQALPGFVYREYAARDGCRLGDRREWRRANPAIRAGFLHIEALDTALAMSLPSHFRIFRLGQWVEGVESWLGDDGRYVLDPLRSDYQLVPGAPTWVGVDVGIVHDSSAVTCVQYRTDRPDVLHAVTRIWVPTKAEPVDVTDIMAHLRDLSKTYRLGAVSFDPRFFDVPAKWLYDEGIPMVEVPQSVEHMTGAIGDLYERIHHGLVTFAPDPLFEQQVLNAVARLNERGFTLSKGKSRGRIDSAISWALAVDRATHKRMRSAVVVL
jgi:phage terminase large subunit-like protein